jgi:hypothetical protein
MTHTFNKSFTEIVWDCLVVGLSMLIHGHSMGADDHPKEIPLKSSRGIPMGRLFTRMPMT